MLNQVGGSIVEHKTTYDLEGLRTGTHAVVPTPPDGIVEVVVGQL